MPDLELDLERVRERIAARGGRVGQPLSIQEETGSTNDDAKAGAKEKAPHGAVWLAETQTKGRGRQGRVWTSPRGENLLFSVLLRISCIPSRVPPLSLAVGLIVRDAVSKALNKDNDDSGAVKVKWPNDVLLRGKKVAGILIESALAGSKIEHIIVGIGVNVHTRDLPEELRPIATSIALESPKTPPDRAEILAVILAGLDHDIEHVAHRGLGMIHGRLSASDALLGRKVSSDDGKIEGVARGIDVEGRLVIETLQGPIVKVASGEVRLVLNP